VNSLLLSIPRRAWLGAALLSAAIATAAVSTATSRRTGTAHETSPHAMSPGVGAPGGPATTVDGLRGRVSEMEARLRDRPADIEAAILLADALLRQARATTDVRPAGRAATVLETMLRSSPGTYDGLRLLGAIDLSLHRFEAALEVGRRARDMRPDDAWNYGVIGDAQIELGDYDAAFGAFDRMMQLRPGPGAYARAAYALELTGHLDGALQAMDMAYSATAPQDPEALAWYSTQIGEVQLKLGRTADADRSFRRALFTFPQYPLAMIGTGKVRAALGNSEEALAIYLEQFGRTPTLDLAARIGDLHAAAGRVDAAEHYYELAEDLAGPVAAQTEATLALFLAEHNRKPREAVSIAERVASWRHDIQTEHALAWSYYKAGRAGDAQAAMALALRTGSRDELLLAHAAAIRSGTR
jgi:tetratricopeptide (TPR) repeat protein